MDVVTEIERARQELRANKKFAGRLKRRPPKHLDAAFQEQHEAVFDDLDCLECANCCKTTSPIFRDVDIERLSRHLGIRPAELVENHLHLDGEGDYVLNVAPCPFLGPDNYCSVYEARPRACREYPHTDRKNMYQILPLTVRNTLVCPAVGEVMRRLRTVSLLLLLPLLLTAGPWPQPKGKGYFKLYEWWMQFDEHYTGTGELDPNATIGLYNTVIYAEYGLSDRLTAVANLPLYSRSTVNTQLSGTRGSVITEGDAIGGPGDAELGARYAISRPGSVWPVAVGLYLGLPLGEDAGGKAQNLQTGDGEFNQLLQLEAGRSFASPSGNLYVSARVGFNNRSNGFSDEIRFGLEGGVSFLSDRLWLITRLGGSESTFNGETAETTQSTSIFSNNAEYLSLGGEINYYITGGVGVSAGYAGALSGRVIAAAPVYSAGVFYDLNR